MRSVSRSRIRFCSAPTARSTDRFFNRAGSSRIGLLVAVVLEEHRLRGSRFFTQSARCCPGTLQALVGQSGEPCFWARFWPIAAGGDRLLPTQSRRSVFPKAASETKASCVINHVESARAVVHTEEGGRDSRINSPPMPRRRAGTVSLGTWTWFERRATRLRPCHAPPHLPGGEGSARRRGKIGSKSVSKIVGSGGREMGLFLSLSILRPHALAAFNDAPMKE